MKVPTPTPSPGMRDPIRCYEEDFPEQLQAEMRTKSAQKKEDRAFKEIALRPGILFRNEPLFFPDYRRTSWRMERHEVIYPRRKRYILVATYESHYVAIPFNMNGYDVKGGSQQDEYVSVRVGKSPSSFEAQSKHEPLVVAYMHPSHDNFIHSKATAHFTHPQVCQYNRKIIIDGCLETKSVSALVDLIRENAYPLPEVSEETCGTQTPSVT